MSFQNICFKHSNLRIVQSGALKLKNKIKDFLFTFFASQMSKD